ncbi:hypothetical protein Q7421_04690 [Glaesserella parasuis]|nr:hypothetical protein [Glaesserella parasuis]
MGCGKSGNLASISVELGTITPEKQSMKGKLTAAGWSDEFRDELLLGV